MLKLQILEDLGQRGFTDRIMLPQGTIYAHNRTDMRFYALSSFIKRRTGFYYYAKFKLEFLSSTIAWDGTVVMENVIPRGKMDLFIKWISFRDGDKRAVVVCNQTPCRILSEHVKFEDSIHVQLKELQHESIGANWGIIEEI